MLKHSTLLSSLGLAASLCGVALPSTAASLPAVQHAGNITFVTGGIGLDESTAFKSAMKEWPLTLLFAERIGQRAEYVANVQVEVSDLKGHTAIDTTSQGPFMLANVQPGSYKVAATLDGKTLRQVVAVTQGKAAKATFLWPEHAGEQP